MNTIEGDLLEITRGVILHQANCLGATSGLAGALRRKWPVAFEDCLRMTEAAKAQGKSSDLLGRFLLSSASGPGNHGSLFLCHVFGQVFPGPNTNLEAADQALQAIFKSRSCGGASHPLFRLPLYAPHGMGCGLGGGDWSLYEPMLERRLPMLTLVKKDPAL